MFCKVCYYDLRGLSEPRCPECGTQFNPADVTTYLMEVPDLRAQSLRRIAWMLAIALVAAFLIMVHLVPSFFFGPPSSGH